MRGKPSVAPVQLRSGSGSRDAPPLRASGGASSSPALAPPALPAVPASPGGRKYRDRSSVRASPVLGVHGACGAWERVR